MTKVSPAFTALINERVAIGFNGSSARDLQERLHPPAL
jgi:hypothetical protein